MTDSSTNRLLSSTKLGLVWFGASVSLAEILTGTFFAPLGIELGLCAIVLGHVIGCVLLWLVAYISAKTGASAMEAAGRSFGSIGSKAFACANVVQLVGWTAIMVFSGAVAANALVPSFDIACWCVVIGLLIVLWIGIGVKRMGAAQSIAAVLLFALTIFMSSVFIGPMPTPTYSGDALTFGAAVELAVAMPLSWLPVVGDYTREAISPKSGSICAAISYFAGSCWMFLIGLACAVLFGTDDIAQVLSQLGFGVVGIAIVVLSTVTTTFLDAQSAGISLNVIWGKIDARIAGIACAALGTVLAACAPVGEFEGFLYFIGSVFAPMAALVVADYFITKRNSSTVLFDARNVVLWAIGFALYRLSLGCDLPCGNTLLVFVVVVLAAAIVDKVAKGMSDL